MKVESTNRHSSDSEEDDICILKRFSHMTYAKDKSRVSNPHQFIINIPLIIVCVLGQCLPCLYI